MLESRLFRLLCFLLVGSTSAAAAEFEVETLQQRIYSTVESVRPAVVSIQQRGGMFSGVIVSDEGHILSAGHAVRPGGRYRVLLPDRETPLTAIGKGSNAIADCALLKITTEVEDLPYVQMGESSSLVRNQPCLSISFPGGQGTRGVPVVRFGRIVRPAQGRKMLQSTALMEPGDSGGPLFDLQGRVIGIHSRIGQSMTRNFEVPVDTFKKYWNELNREKSFTQSGPPTPKLGFFGENRRDGTGIDVQRIVEKSLAESLGMKSNDLILSVDGKDTPSLEELRRALIAARDGGVEEIVVNLRREEEDLELKAPFNVEREAAPEVALPDYGDQTFLEPEAIAQLANLPKEFSEMEAQLDDACVEISSNLSNGEGLRIVGTMIKATPFIVSKSSMVHEAPTTNIGAMELELEVITRDSSNDLVLLKAPADNVAGIDLTSEAEAIPSIGTFLIAPDSSGPGLVSVVSTKSFPSRKQASRGFLGVYPENYQDKGGAILRRVTEDGAAKRAGLKVGDVVTQLNDTSITTHSDMRQFLRTLDPDAIVIAKIIRGEDELEKTIRLGAVPPPSNHAANLMDKSGRRDGFQKVIPHDADLDPADCGGPIFDLEGNFVGLNIARNSRVRSYAIPREIIEEFLEQQ